MSNKEKVKLFAKAIQELSKKYGVILQGDCENDLTIWFPDHKSYHLDGSRCYDSCSL